MIPSLTWWQWTLGAFCAFQIGAAKTGLPGFGVLAIPLMVLAAGNARESVGWMLPIMCVADLLAIWYWRRNMAAKKLFSLAPWMLAGMGIGAVALSLPERILRPMIGVIIFVMLMLYLYRRMRTTEVPPHPAVYGAAAGFATTVANAAGPVMNLYLLSKKLPKEEFVATGAWFFFFVNLSKLPIYAWHGLFSRKSLTFDAMLIPAIVAGAYAGRYLLRRMPPKVFEGLVIVLTAIATLLLFR